MPKSPPQKNFATKLQDLEALVAKLESPDTSLEQSLSDFERGIKLIREAQEELTRAEQRVQELMDDGDEPAAAGDE